MAKEETEKEKLKAWLLPDTGQFFVHEGARLHVRHWLPAATNSLRATIFYIHGLNGHVNRPTLTDTCQRLAASGFAVLSFDLEGNGYSEGERSYVQDFEDVFQSIFAFVELVMSDEEEASDGDSNLGIADNLLKRLRALPYFFFGESMGGMLAMYISGRLEQAAEGAAWANNHRGTILCAPALAVKIPSPVVVCILQNAVVPLASKQLMPEAVSSSSKPDPALEIRDPQQRAMLELDDWHRFPGVGLGWKLKMRWGTASAFATLYGRIEEDMADVSCPLLVLHDPEDQITNISGSRRLIELSTSNDKTLVDAPNSLHDILSNEKDWGLRIITQWLVARS